MTKYRIVEKGDGFFYIEYKFLFWYTQATNLLHQPIRGTSLKDAQRIINGWKIREEQEIKENSIIKIHKV